MGGLVIEEPGVAGSDFAMVGGVWGTRGELVMMGDFDRRDWACAVSHVRCSAYKLTFTRLWSKRMIEPPKLAFLTDI
jgi:hypothetical protein